MIIGRTEEGCVYDIGHVYRPEEDAWESNILTTYWFFSFRQLQIPALRIFR